MKKKTSRKSTRTQVKGFEPAKVGFSVAVVAVVSLVLFAILARSLAS